MQYTIFFERNGIEESLTTEVSFPLDHNSAVMEVYAMLADEPYSRQVPRGEDSVLYTLAAAGVDAESIRFVAA